MIKFLIRFWLVLPVLGLLLLLTGLGLAAWNKQFNDVSTVLSVVGLVLFLTIFLLGETSNLIFYANVSVATLITLAIVVVLYLFADAHKDIQWDATKEKRNKLAPQTELVVKNLKTPVKLIAFCNETTEPPASMTREYLQRYANLSKQVNLEIVDPVRDALKVTQYKQLFNTEITGGNIFVENVSKPAASQPGMPAAKPRFKRVTLPESRESQTIDALESPVTNGIIEVTQDKAVKIDVLQGPGYKSLDYVAMDKSRSISTLKQMLSDQAMDIEALPAGSSIPSDCSVLLAVGVHQPLFKPEVEKIGDYLDRGGKLLVFFETPDKGDDLSGWTDLLGRYGLKPTNNIVVDYSGAQIMNNPSIMVVSHYDESHPITKDMEQQQMAVPGVRSIERVNPPPQGYTITDLMQSSPQSWTMPLDQLIQMVQTSGLVMPSKDKIKAQPLALALSRDNQPNGMKIVVVGNADIVSDQALGSPMGTATLNFTTLSLNWLAGNEDRLAIPPRQLEDTPLPASDAEMTLVFILVVLSMPATVLFGGLTYTMLRRRSR